MDEIKNEFNKRVKEINQYFDFLKEVESSCVVYLHTMRTVDASLRPTLRANAFCYSIIY